MRHDSSIWHPAPWRPEAEGGREGGGVKVEEGGWAICLDYINSSKSHGRAGERERSAVITCGSLISESTSRLCVYFSLFPRGTELLEERPHTHELSLICTAPHTSTPIFSQETIVTMKTEWQLCPLGLHVFSRWWQSPETTVHTQADEPIIFLNMSLCCCCDGAVITGVTASLARISWQMFASLSQAQWDHPYVNNKQMIEGAYTQRCMLGCWTFSESIKSDETNNHKRGIQLDKLSERLNATCRQPSIQDAITQP